MPPNDKKPPGKRPRKKVENLFEKNAKAEAKNLNSVSVKMKKATQKEKKEAEQKIDTGNVSSLLNNLAKYSTSLIDNTQKLSLEAAKGIKKLSVSSTEAVYNATKEYAGAITQDFNVNKQSVVAMSLAKSSPIFGYFAAKFMETDVFKKAAERIKESIGGALSFVGDKFGALMSRGWGKLKALFGGKQTGDNIKKNFKVPSMQVGGYVMKGGLVNVHPAEVVMPIDKVMAMIQGKAFKGGETENKIVSALNLLTATNKDYYKSFKEDKKERKWFYQTFIDSLKEQNSDMLTEIKIALAGQFTTFKALEIAWQKTIQNHPTLKMAMMMGKLGMETIKGIASGVTLRWLFKRRNKYATDLPGSELPPLEKIASITATSYVTQSQMMETQTKLLMGIFETNADLATIHTNKKYTIPDRLPDRIFAKAMFKGESIFTKLIKAPGRVKEWGKEKVEGVKDFGKAAWGKAKDIAREAKFTGRTLGLFVQQSLELMGFEYHESTKDRGIFDTLADTGNVNLVPMIAPPRENTAEQHEFAFKTQKTYADNYFVDNAMEYIKVANYGKIASSVNFKTSAMAITAAPIYLEEIVRNTGSIAKHAKETAEDTSEMNTRGKFGLLFKGAGMIKNLISGALDKLGGIASGLVGPISGFLAPIAGMLGMKGVASWLTKRASVAAGVEAVAAASKTSMLAQLGATAVSLLSMPIVLAALGAASVGAAIYLYKEGEGKGFLGAEAAFMARAESKLTGRKVTAETTERKVLEVKGIRGAEPVYKPSAAELAELAKPLSVEEDSLFGYKSFLNKVNPAALRRFKEEFESAFPENLKIKNMNPEMFKAQRLKSFADYVTMKVQGADPETVKLNALMAAYNLKKSIGIKAEQFGKDNPRVREAYIAGAEAGAQGKQITEEMMAEYEPRLREAVKAGITEGNALLLEHGIDTNAEMAKITEKVENLVMVSDLVLMDIRDKIASGQYSKEMQELMTTDREEFFKRAADIVAQSTNINSTQISEAFTNIQNQGGEMLDSFDITWDNTLGTILRGDLK